MTQRTLASWVEPLAEANRESRANLVRVARQIPDELWPQPSPLPNWSYKDVLAHLAGDTEKLFITILRSVVAREPIDTVLFGEPDERNERDVESRRDRSVEELLAEIDADSEEIQELLSRLSDEDKDLRQENVPTSLGEALSNEPGGHYRGHMAHLQTALDAIML